MATRFWVGGTGTWDASTTTNWAASSGGAGGQTVPTSADTVTFDGSSGGGTVTVNTNVDVQSITMGAFTGTLDFATNNNSVRLRAGATGFSGTGSGARTLNMGSNTWTLNSTSGNSWDVTTATNFTLNCGTSTILFDTTGTAARNFIGGASKTYNNLTVTNPASCQFIFDLAQSNTCTFSGAVNFNANTRYVRLPAAALTITGAITFGGTSGAPCMMTVSTGGTCTLSVGAANTWDYTALEGITKSGVGSIAATNSFDCGGNTSITITAPSGGGGLLVNPGLSGGML